MALLSCRWCASIVAAELQLGSDSGEYFSSLLRAVFLLHNMQYALGGYLVLVHLKAPFL